MKNAHKYPAYFGKLAYSVARGLNGLTPQVQKINYVTVYIKWRKRLEAAHSIAFFVYHVVDWNKWCLLPALLFVQSWKQPWHDMSLTYHTDIELHQYECFHL